MRLPCDAALIVIDARRAFEAPGNNPGAETMIAELVAAWRAEALPVFHVRHDAGEPASPRLPDAPGAGFEREAAQRPGETVIERSADSAFAGTGLEEALDAIGATTLVVCGALTGDAVEATVRHGAGLGYRIFVVADACWAVDERDLAGRLRPAEEVHALSLAHMRGGYAEVVDGATALRAAGLANARRRAQAAVAGGS